MRHSKFAIEDTKEELEYISGLVERITFHNPENGFAVLKVKVKGHKDLVPVVGNTPAVSPGEYIKCSGRWHNDFNHGLQFKADFLKSLPPSTLEGMEKYLGSGMIKGIGPHFAKRLISAFGRQTFEVIEQSSERLTKVEGIGKIRAERLCKNWEEQKAVREIMVFLQSHGVGTARATRIYKTYGEQAIKIVSENPYILAKDIKGIGFLSADTIARNLGIEPNSVIRARAGINHVLLEATSEGHCGLPKEALISTAKELLEIDEEILQSAIQKELEAESITADTIEGIEFIFLTAYYIYEKNIAHRLLALKEGSRTPKNAQNTVSSVEKKLGIKLAAEQKRAVEKALGAKVMVITGGPGTGKTTIINAILAILESEQISIKLCAPTGRAAKRLAESTGHKYDSTTIHRLLETDPAHGGFKRNEECPLECDYIVIDEASMVDVALFYALLKAMPPKAALLMVGDVDQLPSVGAGQVLADIIDSGAFAVARLTEIFRQEKASNIVASAHLVNKGFVPDLEHKQNSDFYFIAGKENKDLSNDIMQKLLLIVKERIPATFGLDPMKDIQVLCPTQRGGLGVRSMNIELQKALNPSKHSIVKFGQNFAVGDKVMQMENNHDNEIYNGDIGFIRNINEQEQTVMISFDSHEVTYDYGDLDQINLAYATTIHKSQGSEYPAVVIPLTMQSFMMLKRKLIYTAITRGKKLVVMLGEKKALIMAIKNIKGEKRHTKLKEWIQKD